MAEYIVMPKLGFDMREGELNAWLYEIGQQVNKGDIVAEIDSDKATLELESQVSGVLLATLATPGDLVAVGVPFVLDNDLATIKCQGVGVGSPNPGPSMAGVWGR